MGSGWTTHLTPNLATFNQRLPPKISGNCSHQIVPCHSKPASGKTNVNAMTPRLLRHHNTSITLSTGTNLLQNAQSLMHCQPPWLKKPYARFRRHMWRWTSLARMFPKLAPAKDSSSSYHAWRALQLLLDWLSLGFALNCQSNLLWERVSRNKKKREEKESKG